MVRGLLRFRTRDATYGSVLYEPRRAVVNVYVAGCGALAESEVSEPGRREGPTAGAFGDEDAARVVSHVAYVSGGHVAQGAGQPAQVAWADGEEQLEIFAAVERELERVERAPPAEGDDGRVDGDAPGLYDRADAARAAEVREVG